MLYGSTWATALAPVSPSLLLGCPSCCRDSLSFSASLLTAAPSAVALLVRWSKFSSVF
ncbi:hypothetical protein PF001_g14314 [Phytophthora fragariae]|uniref:Uncharacterized protein n=1 Tax=Phytophthora fragariae TaxID=53985 RepID=A0A6A4D9V8_9STRA|nr:hypothetical protein PF001_g14314 [Phytophthora fragariae]